MHKKLLVALSAVGMLTLAGCGGDTPTPPVKQDLEPPLSGEYVADFSLGESEEIFASDGWSNGQPFNAVWKKSNLTYSDGEMHLGIKDEPTVASEVEYPYTAGEARTHHLYGYGDYMVKMKPTNVVGSVSTFFTFTYDGDKIDGVANKHDEIDIEFLGKDTTKVQFNYFVGGVGEHEFMYDLGFDASEDFHEYGFRWEENKITWVVDGKIAREVTGDKTTLPSCPGRIMSSYWPSSADDWSGHFAGATDDTVDYKYIKASATGIWADGEEPVPPFDEDIDWSEVDAFDNDYWNGGSHYTINKIEKGVEVTYEEAGNWECVGTYIGADGAEAEAVNVTLFNGSDSESTVKVDVQGTTTVGNHNDINVAAYADGHPEVSTDLDWGGSKIVLGAKEEVQLKIELDQTTDRGALTNLAFFLDSLQASNVAHAGGKVVIKDVKLAKLDGTPIVPPAPVPPGPGPQPGGEIDWDKVDPVALTYWASSSDIYSFEDNGTNAVTVNYTDATGYACIGSASANAVVDVNNTAKVTLRNNNEAVAHVRMDIQVTGGASAISFAEAKGHDEVHVAEGSAFIDVAVNESVDLIVEYDPSLGATNVMFFVDSMGEATSGSVTISNVKFAKAEEEPVDFDWDKVDPIDATFVTDEWTGYQMSKDAETGATTVAYDWASGWANVNTGIATDAAGKNAMQLTLKNELEAESVVRIDIKSASDSILNVSSEAAGHEDDTHPEWTYGSRFTLGNKEELILVIHYVETESDTASLLQIYLDSEKAESTKGGKVTISDVKFAKIEESSGEIDWDKVDPVALTYWASNGDIYSFADNSTNEVTVNYTDATGYACIGSASANAVAKENNTLKVTIKNNNDAVAHVRMDVQLSDNASYITTVVATGAENAYVSGGNAFIDIAANGVVEVVVEYEASVDVNNLMFFIDSMGDTPVSGSVTISNVKFATK